MSRKNITVEMRGMPREDLVNYFVAQGAMPVNSEIYISKLWEVRVEKQTVCSLGRLSIPSTKITFIIEEDYYDEMLYKFRMNFMSAGG